MSCSRLECFCNVTFKKLNLSGSAAAYFATDKDVITDNIRGLTTLNNPCIRCGIGCQTAIWNETECMGSYPQSIDSLFRFVTRMGSLPFNDDIIAFLGGRRNIKSPNPSR